MMDWLDQIMNDYRRNKMQRDGNWSDSQFVLPSGAPAEQVVPEPQINESMFNAITNGNGALGLIPGYNQAKVVTDALLNADYNKGIRKQGKGTVGPSNTKKVQEPAPVVPGMSMFADPINLGNPDGAMIPGYGGSRFNEVGSTRYPVPSSGGSKPASKPKSTKSSGKKKVAPKSEPIAIPSAFVQPTVTHADRLAMLNANYGADDEFGMSY